MCEFKVLEREREREREKRELLKMLVVEKKDKESVIYKLRTESGSGGAVVALVGIFSVFLFRLLLPQDFLCNGPHLISCLRGILSFGVGLDSASASFFFFFFFFFFFNYFFF